MAGRVVVGRRVEIVAERRAQRRLVASRRRCARSPPARAAVPVAASSRASAPRFRASAPFARLRQRPAHETFLVAAPAPARFRRPAPLPRRARAGVDQPLRLGQRLGQFGVARRRCRAAPLISSARRRVPASKRAKACSSRRAASASALRCASASAKRPARVERALRMLRSFARRRRSSAAPPRGSASASPAPAVPPPRPRAAQRRARRRSERASRASRRRSARCGARVSRACARGALLLALQRLAGEDQPLQRRAGLRPRRRAAREPCGGDRPAGARLRLARVRSATSTHDSASAASRVSRGFARGPAQGDQGDQRLVAADFGRRARGSARPVGPGASAFQPARRSASARLRGGRDFPRRP